MTAITTLHPGEPVSVVIFVQLAGASEAALAEIMDVVRELAKGHRLVERIEGVIDDAVDGRKLQERLGAGFDEFYYCHDVNGQICRQLAALYPRARKVCIGDGFGMVYATEFLESYRRAAPLPLRARLGAWLRGLGSPVPKPLAPIRPDIAALVLPVDPSGGGLRRVALRVCGKQDFLDAIRACHANARDLQAYERELLARSEGRRRFLLLTETYAEAGFVTPENEIGMYCEIVRAHCEPGSALIVKPHPLEAAGKPARIAAALGAGYEVIAVDRRFARYPVEIWLELVRACKVMSMAYPVLSLKYAHGIDVVQPMDDAFIERWIEPAHRKWTRDSLQLYMEPLARLPHWDGRSVLWSGQPE